MIIAAIQILLVAAGLGLAAVWFVALRASGESSRPTPLALAAGAILNFFDTLGIGSFAPSTALIKFLKLAPDEAIPGTLNVGHAIPTLLGALIFITVVKVDVTLLIACITAAVLGAVLGARIVSRLDAGAIRKGMGAALLVAAAIFAARNLGLLPGGGIAIALTGAAFLAAVGLHFLFGALMTIGVGLYAPALISLSMLGMDPRAAFPIMMGACAFLMPAAGVRFIRARRFDPKLALGFALGGVPGVLIAAFIVKEAPLDLLRWLVTAVVTFAGLMMLFGASSPATKAPAP